MTMTLMKERVSYSGVEDVVLTPFDISESIQIWGSLTISIPIEKEEGQQKMKLTINTFKPEIIGLTVSSIVTIISMITAFLLGQSMLAVLFTAPLLGVLICIGFLTYVIRH